MLTQQGRDIKLDVTRIEGYKNFINKIFNASKFAMMQFDDFTPSNYDKLDKISISLADKWILTRLNEVTKSVDKHIYDYNFSNAASELYQFIWHEFCDWYLELIKTTLYDKSVSKEEKTATKETLYYTLINILKLIHPFMPFVSEELYSILPDSALKDEESIMISSYPKVEENYMYKSSVAEMEFLMEIINNIRNIRGENNISMAKEIKIIIKSDKEDIIKNNVNYLKTQCRASNVEFTNNAKIDLAASKLLKNTTIFIPLKGLVDVESEMNRVNKQLKKVLKDIDFVSKKLNNPRFVDKAPEAVVAKEKEKITQYEQVKSKLENDLAKLELLK
jgi:valyl-tRNA synthetase